MAEPDVMEVIEGIAGWIEPDPAITKDAAHWQPVQRRPDTLYLYPEPETHEPYESGPSVRQNFRLALELVVSALGEHRSGVRERSTTQVLRKRARAYSDRVRQNQRTATHHHLYVGSIEWNALNGLDYRGVRLRLEGYRLWPEEVS